MNKVEFIQQVANACDLPNKQVKPVIQAVLQTITDTLAAGDALALVGFGTFGVKTRAARIGHHPKTKAAIQIPETQVAYFKPGNKLKEAVASAKTTAPAPTHNTSKEKRAANAKK